MGAGDHGETFVFRGSGAAVAQLREAPWASSALGRIETWPRSLVAYMRAILCSRVPSMICWGPELTTLYNDAFLPILGPKHPGAMGTPALACWPEARAFLVDLFAEVQRGEAVFREEVLIPIARGGPVADAWWSYSASPLFDDAGEIAGTLVVCTDVTREMATRQSLEAAEREAGRARAELHGIFMQAPLPMCILTGPHHRYTLANKHYIDLVGRDIIGRTPSEAFTAEEVGYYLPILDRVFQTAEAVVIKEAPLTLKDAAGNVEHRVINAGYHSHRDAHGAVSGVLVVLVDVTHEVDARKKLEQDAEVHSVRCVQADAQRVEAEAASHAKDQFLATVSHELRTPLTAILGWSRMLLENAIDATAAADSANRQRAIKGLTVIERNAQAQTKLVDDILDVSRIVSGKLRLGLRMVDIAGVIDAAVAAVLPAAQAKGIDFHVEVEGPLPMRGDEDRLQQVIWNLLSNAVKFTPPGGAVIVHAFAHEHAIRLQVRDTGTGIAEAFLPFVFDRFRQHDASTTKRHAGMGLGLSIVRHLVELHGGTVSAQSAGAERGSTFEVMLPVRDEDAPPLVVVRRDPSDIRAKRMARARENLKDRRILVVDDQVDAREVIAVVLEDAGAWVVQAASSRAAIDLLATTEISAIVSDIGMPGQDGYALLRRVRSTPRTELIPALALTAYARIEERELALASGFQEHLAKPIDPVAIVTGVAALLQR